MAPIRLDSPSSILTKWKEGTSCPLTFPCSLWHAPPPTPILCTHKVNK